METAKKHISYCIVFLMLCLTGMVLFGHNVIAEAAGAYDTYVGGEGVCPDIPESMGGWR